MRLNKVLLVVALLVVFLGLSGSVLVSVGLGTQAEVDLEKGLVAYWKFDEGEGDIIFDETGNNDVGLPMCAGEGCSRPKWVEGKIGLALEFDGVDDYVDCGNDESLNFTSEDFSIAMWVNLSKVSGTQMLFCRGAYKSYGYYLFADGKYVRFATHQLDTAQGSSTAYMLTAGNWYHIVVRRIGSSVGIYLNAKAATAHAAEHIDPASTTTKAIIGRYSANIGSTV